jgi:hypothetical protein
VLTFPEWLGIVDSINKVLDDGQVGRKMLHEGVPTIDEFPPDVRTTMAYANDASRR